MDRKTARSAEPEIDIPPAYDWRTSDTDEINKRRLRARLEPLHVTELGGDHPIFANFRVSSGSGMSYAVEIRSLRERLFFCTCVDFASTASAAASMSRPLCTTSRPDMAADSPRPG